MLRDDEFRSRFKLAKQKAIDELRVTEPELSRIEVSMTTLALLRWHMTEFWRMSTHDEERRGIVGHLVYMCDSGHINDVPIYTNDDLRVHQFIFEA